MNKKKWFIVSILLAVLAGAAFYFLYFIKTPAYALNETRLAVQEHDTTKFTRYVDVNSVMDNAFDDIIKAESKINVGAEVVAAVHNGNPRSKRALAYHMALKLALVNRQISISRTLALSKKLQQQTLEVVDIGRA